MELSVMCGCEIALVIFDLHGKPLQYVSDGDIDDTLKKFVDYDHKVDEFYTNEDVHALSSTLRREPLHCARTRERICCTHERAHAPTKHGT